MNGLSFNLDFQIVTRDFGSRSSSISTKMSSDEIQSSLEAIRLTLKKLDDKFTFALANQNYRFQAIDDRLKFVENFNEKTSNTRDLCRDVTGNSRGVNNNHPIDPPAVQNPSFEGDEDNLKSTASNGKMRDSIISLHSQYTLFPSKFEPL